MSQQKQAIKAHIAERPTGPRAEEGKAVSSQNRLTHVLCAKKYAIHPSQRPEFERHYNEMLAALVPVGAVSVFGERVNRPQSADTSRLIDTNPPGLLGTRYLEVRTRG